MSNCSPLVKDLVRYLVMEDTYGTQDLTEALQVSQSLDAIILEAMLQEAFEDKEFDQVINSINGLSQTLEKAREGKLQNIKKAVQAASSEAANIKGGVHGKWDLLSKLPGSDKRKLADLVIRVESLLSTVRNVTGEFGKYIDLAGIDASDPEKAALPLKDLFDASTQRGINSARVAAGLKRSMKPEGILNKIIDKLGGDALSDPLGGFLNPDSLILDLMGLTVGEAKDLSGAVSSSLEAAPPPVLDQEDAVDLVASSSSEGEAPEGAIPSQQAGTGKLRGNLKWNKFARDLSRRIPNIAGRDKKETRAQIRDILSDLGVVWESLSKDDAEKILKEILERDLMTAPKGQTAKIASDIEDFKRWRRLSGVYEGGDE